MFAVSHRIRILDLELSNVCKNARFGFILNSGSKRNFFFTSSFNQNGLHISANGENVGLNPQAFTK